MAMAEAVTVRCIGRFVEVGAGLPGGIPGGVVEPPCGHTDTRLRAQVGEGCPQCGGAVEEVPVSNLAAEIGAAVGHLRGLGYTRIQIAAAIGVDRRSLYAWASGQAQPTAEHLQTLRHLVESAREPLWAPAARALAAGRLEPPQRAGTVRPASVDEAQADPASPSPDRKQQAIAAAAVALADKDFFKHHWERREVARVAIEAAWDLLASDSHALRVGLAEQVRRLAEADRNWEAEVVRRQACQERAEMLLRAFQRHAVAANDLRKALADLLEEGSNHGAPTEGPYYQAAARALELLGRGGADA